MRRHSIVLITGLFMILAGSFISLGLAGTPEKAGSGQAATTPEKGTSPAGTIRVPDTIKETPEPDSEPLLVKGDVEPPELIDKVQPEYPEDARRAGIEGKVILEAIINADGDVENVRVLRKIPDAPSLEEAAMDAVRQWRYKPAMRGGQPVKVFFTVVMDFSLPPPQIPDLEVLEARSQPVALDFKKAPLPRLFRVLEGVSGLTIELRGDFPADLTATLDWKEITLQDALQRLAKQFDLKYRVEDPRTLTVIREEKKEAGAVEAR